MARIRTIKPEFADSESMGRISREARLLFVLIWTQSDDEGRMRGALRYLASKLFPYDEDAPDLIGRWLCELEEERCITRYSVNGDAYVQVIHWLDHQKIEKPTPSKIPPPPNLNAKSIEVVGIPRTLTEHSPNPPRVIVGRSRSVDLDQDRDRDREKDQTPPSPPQAGGGADRWEPVCAALASLYGGTSWRNRKGERQAWVGECVGVLGRYSDDDPNMALAKLASFRETTDSRFFPNKTNLAARLGVWLDGGERSNGHLPRTASGGYSALEIA